MLQSTVSHGPATLSAKSATQRCRPNAFISRKAHIFHAAASSPAAGVSYQHVMVAVLDEDPYLSAGSRQAINAAADITNQHKSKLTVLLADEKEQEPNQVRLDTLNWHLRERGCPDYQVVEKAVASASSVLIGDVADELDADIMVVSADAVHSKRVDANQLAEFVSCPVLILP